MRCKKVSYKSYEKAFDAAVRIEVSNGDYYPKLKPYKCPVCSKKEELTQGNGVYKK